jgi:hypothetical protein
MLGNTALLLLGCAALTGCLYGSSTSKQESFTKAEVKKIEPGKTTKEEILKWFGAPLAIARKGDEDKVILAENVRAETFLELFAAKRTLTESNIIYYYRNLETNSAGGVIVFAVMQQNRTATTKLWVLIDNRSGLVEDYVTIDKP